MKKIKILLICFHLSTGVAIAQNSDTLMFKEGHILWRKFNWSTEEKKGKITYIVNNKEVSKEYFEKEERANDSAMKAMDSLGNPYFKYYSKDGRIVEEGFWAEGIRIRYHRNGKLKEKGNFNKIGIRMGDWYFYNRRGKLKRKQNFAPAFARVPRV
jgi:antitoxin component YwqK of YwqJK toxin-antitoxin module